MSPTQWIACDMNKIGLIDARLYQLLCLTLFLILGVISRDWTISAPHIGWIIVTCLSVQLIGTWARGAIGPTLGSAWADAAMLKSLLSSLPSALITSLGLSLLLRADSWITLVLAGTAAIGSKFLLRLNGKHLFNPGNFGIIMALLLAPDAWVSPGQWGEEQWYVLVFVATGGLVLRQVGRWDTSIAFLLTYAGLEAVRNVWLGWTWDVWLHRLSSGSLWLFALFMITDPRTIPDARAARLIWAGAIALLTFYLRNVWFISTAPFWALFVLAPFSVLLDWRFPADRFDWADTAPKAVEVQSARCGVLDVGC